MNGLSLDWPQSATSLLSQAKQASASDGELVRLIMAGTLHLDSWLIENRVIPALHDRETGVLYFSLTSSGQDKGSTALVPIPDGSAFGRSTSGHWSILEAPEALREIQHIGLRYAPDNEWVDGFKAVLSKPATAPVAPVTPDEVARFWEEVTGSKPLGFEAGVLDRLQSIGLDMMHKTFKHQGRLGL